MILTPLSLSMQERFPSCAAPQTLPRCGTSGYLRCGGMELRQRRDSVWPGFPVLPPLPGTQHVVCATSFEQGVLLTMYSQTISPGKTLVGCIAGVMCAGVTCVVMPWALSLSGWFTPLSWCRSCGMAFESPFNIVAVSVQRRRFNCRLLPSTWALECHSRFVGSC